MAITESQRRAVARYEAANCKKMTFKFQIKTESDIIDQLEKQDNKAGYIKRLIREDIAREQKLNRE